MSDESKFQEMLQLAEFGVKRMEERRAFEFKIFISYSTLLVLALYQLIRQGNPISVFFQLTLQKDSISLELREGIILYVLALLMHVAYVMWQIGVGIAMRNDSRRRNFYLKEAEKSSGKPLNYVEKISCKPLKCSVSDKEIVIIKNYLQQFWHVDLIWRDWSRMFVVAIPTILFSIIVYLFIGKFYGSMDIDYILASIPMIFFPFGLVVWVVKEIRGKLKRG